MQPSLFQDIEQINVEVIYGGLLVSLARSDYTFLLMLLQNLNEKPADSQELPSLEVSKVEAKTVANSDSSNISNLANNMTLLSSDTLNSVENLVPNTIVCVFIQSIRVHLHNDSNKDELKTNVRN
jgi:hypothetical protein